MAEFAADLLFELGTEELPPKSLLSLRDALVAGVADGLEKADLAFSGIQGFASPRRLALVVNHLSAMQPDKRVERRGPARKAAFSPDGQATPALLGFLNSCGASLDQAQILSTDKGEWIVVTQELQGASVDILVPAILKEALDALPVAKRMRWGDLDCEFVRPVHWVVLLHGSRVLPAEFFGVSTGQTTRGHRFHHPASIHLASASNYAETLESTGRVMADFDLRRLRVREAVVAAAAEANGKPILDEALIDEVTALVEWPVPIIASFEPAFLSVPREALIATMQANQKYFPLEDDKGALLPRFVTVSNLASTRPEAIRAGNERVVRPRLADAQFFWKKDQQRGLEVMTRELSTLVFHEKLGTVAQKVERIERLLTEFKTQLDLPDEVFEAARTAAQFCKADLRSEMVGEFPELQGTMGRYYALAEGKPGAVSVAIEEHYLPRQSGGALPSSPAGQVLAMADRIDTIAGIFAIGLAPTGDKDPFGVRRAALGVIRIVLECAHDLDVQALCRCSLEHYQHCLTAQRSEIPTFLLDDVAASVWTFVLDRMRGYCQERGTAPDEWEAVTAVAGGRLLDIESRLRAVKLFRSLPEAEALAAANKRIRNILRKAEETSDGLPDVSLFKEPEEAALFSAAQQARVALEPLLLHSQYSSALQRLAELREPTDAFFDRVLVNAEDVLVRRNRFRLLATIENSFRLIADIGRLQS